MMSLSSSSSSSFTTTATLKPSQLQHRYCFFSPNTNSKLSLSPNPNPNPNPRQLHLSLHSSPTPTPTLTNAYSNPFSPKETETETETEYSKQKLKVAIVGFGNFGQFLAKQIVNQGHHVLAYSRSDYSRVAADMGVHFFSDADDLCEEHPEVILLCTSILSTEKVLRGLPLHRLRRSTLFVDVLSVKEFPRSLFLQVLPPELDILCTHPMFGPDSGKAGWAGLPFVYDKVRVGAGGRREARVEAFLDVFRGAGCRMVEMSCAEHDKYAAGSQFITHMMGRVLEKLGLESTPINTRGYESLLNLVDNSARDSFELFYGLFLYNKNAMEELERMDWAFEMVKNQLSGYLHGMVRKQLMLETYGTPALDSGPNMLPPPPSPSASHIILAPHDNSNQPDLVLLPLNARPKTSPEL